MKVVSVNRGMMVLRSSLVLILIAASFAPLTAAEFGQESDDGFPVNVDGQVLYPPVKPVPYADLGLPEQQAGDPLNKVGPLTVYPYYPILTAEVQRMALDHPDLVKLTSAGKSRLGLDLWLLEIADFGNPDMIPLDQREVVYLDGGTHSNEYSGVYFVTEVAQFLIEEYDTDETAKWIVENRHTWILPMVNPDGSHAFGRLNAVGVNVNRNFPFTWGTVDEDPVLNNPGPEPASEPETQIVMQLFEQLKPDYVASIHCCGNLWLHPYGAEQLGDAEDLEMYGRICDEVYADVRDRCGPIWSTIYPASGSTTDEAYGRAGSSSWGFEMSGRGAIAPWGQPTINQDVRIQERESWGGVMHAFLNVEKYGAWPVITSILGTGEELVISIANEGYGPLKSGTIMIGDATVQMPELAPNQTAKVTIIGTFEEGETSLGLEWQDRIMLAPVDSRSYSLSLEDQGGVLAGVLAGNKPLNPDAAGPDIDQPADTPAPVALLVLLALVVGAVIVRRRA